MTRDKIDETETPDTVPNEIPDDDENPVAAAIAAAEEIPDPLAGLIERTADDPGAPFAPEVLERLSAMKKAQFVNCMRHLVTAAARQARSLAPGARPTRWNQLR